MIKRDELIKTINKIIGEDLLEKANKIDHRANGVQVSGTQEVNKIALGVSTSMDFFEEAVDSGAEFCIVHHGLDFAGIYNSLLNKSQQQVLKYVFANNLTVSGYHYSLDAHHEIGNNATIIKLIGAKITDDPYFDEWGWVAEFDNAVDAKELADKCAEVFEHDVFAVYGGPEKIKRIGVCSGGARPAGKLVHDIY